MHIAESHSFRVDLTMIFFVTLAWLFACGSPSAGRWSDYLWAGRRGGAAIGSKYSAAFILGVIAVAHLLTPRRPRHLARRARLAVWIAARAESPRSAFAVFAIINPMAFIYREKFWQDIHEQIIDPVVTGSVTPFCVAQFTDVQPQAVLVHDEPLVEPGSGAGGLGLAGIALLLWQWRRPTLVAAAFPLFYFLTAGGTRRRWRATRCRWRRPSPWPPEPSALRSCASGHGVLRRWPSPAFLSGQPRFTRSPT